MSEWEPRTAPRERFQAGGREGEEGEETQSTEQDGTRVPELGQDDKGNPQTTTTDGVSCVGTSGRGGLLTLEFLMGREWRKYGGYGVLPIEDIGGHLQSPNVCFEQGGQGG